MMNRFAKGLGTGRRRRGSNEGELLTAPPNGKADAKPCKVASSWHRLVLSGAVPLTTHLESLFGICSFSLLLKILEVFLSYLAAW